ncbi:YggS family pyridoxal phosphate-dependent enzyme [Brucepastera parasyntrophica]|uniref:YggS family pyridoxal phosphate-dependent enzyme n=1 Tax=Brucepastera parasyntrophica TaxID=2880008 RepID=UPI00210ACC11|nr:YggS family pyridoxal phosphate-dependent enzyme [Brucepastera parasyntrophica]ULQ60063.1 YggS family pyridoxal phosphate-dependent enzyme [Brucepastera parasyntrophica]
MGIRENLKKIYEDIHTSALKAGRHPGDVKLLAVSKFHPAEAIVEASDAGQFLFGENRVQEAVAKFTGILSENSSVSLHLIGTLQRNKVKQILPLVSCIQSVDRIHLLEEISKQAVLLKKNVNILFEFHTGETSKSGYLDKEELFRSIDSLERFPNITCKGLMTIAPYTNDVSAVARAFRTLASLSRECSGRYPELDFRELSMGMSSDYHIAIEEGSTMVRIGTAIFGERK